MNTLKDAFLALNPEPGTRYLTRDVCYGSLIEFEPGSSGAFLIATTDGEVYRSKAIFENNAYTGARHPLVLLD